MRPPLRSEKPNYGVWGIRIRRARLDSMTMREVLEAWKRRRLIKRARQDGRHAVAECRRMLKKRGYLVAAGATEELESQMQDVEVAAGHDHLEQLRPAIERLNEKMNKHLALARKSVVREYAEWLGVPAGVYIFLQAFVVQAFHIPSGSMEPTLQVGDRIYVARSSYGITIPLTDKKLVDFGPPKRGDVVVFKYPKDPSVDYIKRVVGLPGDIIEVRMDQILVNGEAVAREQQLGVCQPEHEGTLDAGTCELWKEHLGSATHDSVVYGEGENFGPIKVPEGRVFMMGDNRDRSSDSRMWGFVPLEYIKGRAIIVAWSRKVATEGSAGGWLPAMRWHRFLTPIK